MNEQNPLGRTYEFPTNDPEYYEEQINSGNKFIDEDNVIGMQPPYRKSNMQESLLICMHLKDQMKVITDMAFDTVDDDNSGGLDAEELNIIMDKVASSMGVTAPSEDDLKAILSVLDDNFDGQVDREEFCNLVMLVIGKMLETEEDLQDKHNEQLNYDWKKFTDDVKEKKKKKLAREEKNRFMSP